MALQVLCPSCHTRYDVADHQAGGTASCPACGTRARIPGLAWPPGGPPDPGGQPPFASPAGDYPVPSFASGGGMPAVMMGYTAGPQAYEVLVAEFEFHRRLIGILGLVVAAIGISLATLYLLGAVAAYQGKMDIQDAANVFSQEEAQLILATTYSIAGGMSLVTAALQLLTGILMLGRKSGCRKLGIATGIVSCMSVWQCCGWLFSLAYGIYAVLALSGYRALVALETPPGMFRAAAADLPPNQQGGPRGPS